MTPATLELAIDELRRRAQAERRAIHRLEDDAARRAVPRRPGVTFGALRRRRAELARIEAALTELAGELKALDAVEAHR